MTAARALIRLAALWRKEALALLRDRHGLAALFLMPAIFILVMSMALRDAFVPGVPADLGYAIVDLDRSEASQALEGQLAGIDLLREFGTLDSEQTGREAVADGRIAFVLVVPRGFEHALGSAASAGHEAAGVRLLADPTVPLAVRNGFRQQVEAELTRLQLSTLLARIGRSLLIPELRDVAGKAPPLPVVVEAVRKPTLADGSESAAPLPSSVQQNVPAWLIFSMFFVVVPISAVFIAERQHGTLQRLATQQVSFGLILAGKLLPFFVVNQVQAVLMVLVGRYLVPLAGGEALTLPTGAASLLALWLMSAAVSVAAVAWALLIASSARSTEQATVIGGVGNILMGAIGGIMVPKFVMPSGMQPLTDLSPMAWALDGFHRVMLRGGAIADVLGPAAALLSFGLAALAVAILLNRRALRALR
ncbi:ABC transporter permease [Parazoarcus communis]|uniref:ABC transporter permease n=1 Tax=Parazoarcus communis TaxID=41977 RepID=A0A2U8GS66_9RHOO|nr:ABC transporter permease [Parazoarcus communis]AWI76529.1 ABC transporter permease [Parazoarcus communis]|tara:strand:+ start:8183 stop:9445 length:1263 start_codon:yes stop_codon:yes gene_type:complete